MSQAHQKKTFVVVDGSSYLFRAYHALPPLTSPQGEPTGAMYGSINMLRKLLKDYQPQKVAVIFDPKGKTQRHEYFAEYKSHRPSMPEDLVPQIEHIHKIIKAMGIPLVVIPGIEADDVIATLAHQAKDKGYHVIISTGDKDMAQLVEKNISLVNTMTGTVLDEAGVRTKFGVPPERIVDYLALIGDTSDNIPGVPKVGPKTAVKWLTAYHSLKGVMEHADEIGGKVGEYLRDSLEQLPMSERLVTLDCDIELPIEVADCKQDQPDRTVLAECYARFGFKRWLTEVEDSTANEHSSSSDNQSKHLSQYEVITTEKQFDHWLQRLHQAQTIALDTETNALNEMTANLVGLSVAIAPGEAAYIPLAHDTKLVPNQLDRAWVLAQLSPIFLDPEKTIIGQNIKYDLNILARCGVEVRANLRDTMLASYVLFSSQVRHDLNTLSRTHLDVTPISFESVAGKGAKQKTFDQIPLDQAAPYAAEDADLTFQLDQILWPQIQKNDDAETVYTAIDIPLLPVLSQIERTGVLIDVKALHKQSKDLKKRLADLEQIVYDLAGEKFNLNSPKQLQHILFEQMELPVRHKTPTGQASTSESVLQALALDYELPQHILAYRSLNKLLSTYVDPLPEQINPETGRIHTSYNQAVTSTGRLSSTHPNLQNIPVRTAEGRRIRQAFIAPKGYRILAADYSQIELRIMAHLSEDRALLEAFAAGKDIHQATAAEIFSVSLKEVSQEQRRQAKAVNFGLLYGMSAFGLARQLKVSRTAAQEIMDCYFARYPSVMAYMDGIRTLAREQSYVQTLFGRHLPTPDIHASVAARRQAAERAVINAPLQGTAADIIKIAMVQVDQWLRESQCQTRMIMQVHDELVFEVPTDELSTMEEHIPVLMGEAAELLVPLEVDVGVGMHWDEAH